MPKTPRLTAKEVVKLLESDGFILDHVTGSHYVFYHPTLKRRVTVPYHCKDLSIGTLKSILKEAGIQI